MHTTIRAALAAMTLIIIAGCYPTERRWEMTYPPPMMEEAPSRKNAPKSIVITVLPFRDARLEVDLSKKPVTIAPKTSLAGWAQNAMAFELDRAGYLVVNASAGPYPGKGAVIKGEVVSASCEKGKNCDITMRAWFSIDGTEYINQLYTSTHRVPFPRVYSTHRLSWAMFNTAIQVLDDVHTVVGDKFAKPKKRIR